MALNDKRPSFLNKLQDGLAKTKKSMINKIEDVLNAAEVDEAMLADLEEALITSDVGLDTTMKITGALRDSIRSMGIKEPSVVRAQLSHIMTKLLDKGEAHQLSQKSPLIILMIGVNGSGKTTSIAKIANKCQKEGKKVLLAAADTFRAAAIEQLEVWGQRLGIGIIKHKEGSDPSAVIFDAIQAAKARRIDVLIVDTAGRLQNKKNLMAELEKMYKVIEREFPEADRETLLVLDAGTGKNAISQAREFGDIADVTGIVLTKLDGTAKGGIVLTIADEFSMPVKFIGVGEGMEDLQVFDPKAFVDALFL